MSLKVQYANATPVNLGSERLVSHKGAANHRLRLRGQCKMMGNAKSLGLGGAEGG